MAIDLLTFRHLLEIKRDYPNLKNVLVLGRQHFLPPNPDERTQRQMTEPPHLNWSSAMFRKRRTDNDEQTTEAGRDYHEVEAS